nr:phosphatase PAP2 family protein [Corynebacterium lactis]
MTFSSKGARSEARSGARNDGIAMTIVGAVVGIFVVLMTGLTVTGSTSDLPITQFFNSWRTGFVGSLADAVYWAFEPTRAVAFVVLLMAVIYVLRASIRLALAFGLTIAVTWLPVAGIKELFQRPRPDRALLTNAVDTLPADWGFPSGHTAFITAVAVALVLVVVASASGQKRAQKILTARVLAAVAIVLIVACVLTEGVHYPTDALASVVWSTSVTPAVWIVVNTLLKKVGPVSLGKATHGDGKDRLGEVEHGKVGHGGAGAHARHLKVQEQVQEK